MILLAVFLKQVTNYLFFFIGFHCLSMTISGAIRRSFVFPAPYYDQKNRKKFHIFFKDSVRQGFYIVSFDQKIKRSKDQKSKNIKKLHKISLIFCSIRLNFEFK